MQGRWPGLERVGGRRAPMAAPHLGFLYVPQPHHGLTRHHEQLGQLVESQRQWQGRKRRGGGSSGGDTAHRPGPSGGGSSLAAGSPAALAGSGAQ